LDLLSSISFELELEKSSEFSILLSNKTLFIEIGMKNFQTEKIIIPITETTETIIIINKPVVNPEF
jgi:hypothetical protein